MILSNSVAHAHLDPEPVWCRDSRGTAYSFGQYLERIRTFHGHPAPGLIIAGKMVQTALDRLPRGILFNALCETDRCLPDAVQLLTPCTIGNGWMRILGFQKFALSLFDKTNGRGYRVWLDAGKLETWKAIRRWFFKTVPKKDQDPALLLHQIQEAGADILSVGEVLVAAPRFLSKKGIGRRRICPVCGEAFPADHGQRCLACQGHSPYAAASEHRPMGIRAIRTED